MGATNTCPIGFIAIISTRRFHISTTPISVAVRPNSGGSGVQRLKKAADRHALGDHCPVVELQSRGLAARIDGEEFGRLLFAAAGIETSFKGSEMPFSAAKMRTRRGLGAGFGLS